MKRFLLFLTFFAVFFVLKSLFSNPILATSFTGYLDNRTGLISITVTYNIYQNNDPTNSCYTSSTVVPAGANSYIPLSVSNCNIPGYLFSWSTNCANISPFQISTNNYFGNPDVHCKTTNTTLTINSASCNNSGGIDNGNITWSVQSLSIGYDGPNIAYFKIFRALSPLTVDADSNPVTVNPSFVSGTSGPLSTFTYTQSPVSLSGVTSGTWNVAVKAYTPSPDNNVTVSTTTFTCGNSTASPSNLNANTACWNSTYARVDFNFYPAVPGSFNYTVQYTNANVADPGGGSPDSSWPNSYTISTTDLTYAKITTFSQASTYWWRVKATRVSDSQVLYSSDNSFTTPSSCTVTYTSPTGINPPITCASSTDPLTSIGTNAGDNYQNADPNLVKISWTRGGSSSGGQAAITQEIIDFDNTDYTWATGVTSIAISGPYTTSLAIYRADFRSTPLTVGGTYHFRVRELMGGQWYVTGLANALFVAPHYCNNNTSLGNGGVAMDNISNFGCNSAGVMISYNTNSNNTATKITSSTYFVIMSDFGQEGTSPGLTFYDSRTNFGGQNVWIVPYWDGVHAGSASNKMAAYSCLVSPTGTFLPPNFLSANLTGTCSNGSPTIAFNFTDESGTSFDYDELDVSNEPFTSQYSTNSHNLWAYKLFTFNHPPYSQTVSFTWSPTSPMQGGNANWQAPSNALIPLDGSTYYWRVKSIDNLGNSTTYTYNDGTVAGTTYPSGAAVVMPVCKNQYDMSANFVAGSWGVTRNNQFVNTQSFLTTDPPVTVNVEVANNKVPTGAASSYQTSLYFYFRGNSGPDPMPVCTSGPQSIIPQDGSGSRNQSYSVSSLAANSKTTINVSFNVGSTPGTYTAYAYVVPSCAFAGDPQNGTDPNWLNNQTPTGFTYSVGVSKFFSATGGDVGSPRSISTGINSSSLSLYQSDYSIVAASVGSNVKSKKNWSLNAYSKSLQINLSSGGVYGYFANKFRSKATQQGQQACSLTSGSSYNGLYYCTGDMNISSTTAISGAAVFFIDGNLNITNGANLQTLNPSDAAVYIVKGNILVDTSTTTLKGVFIANGSFYDCSMSTNNCAATSVLTITGALYVDGQNGGKTNLLRYFSNVSANSTNSSDSFVYDPKYLVLLSNLLASSDIGWQEANP